MSYLLSAAVSLLVSLGTILGFGHTQPAPQTFTPQMQEVMQQYVQNAVKDDAVVGSTLPIAGQTYNLAGSGVSSSATSIILQSLTIKQTGQKILTGDLSSTFYVTLDPGNNSKQEIVSCTTVAQGASSATLSGCTRGLSPISPYTASTTLQFTHAGGAQVIFSDPPQLFNLYTAKDNNETITGTWNVNSLTINNAPVSSTDAVNKTYADALALAGGATSTEANIGFVQLSKGSNTGLGTASSTSGQAFGGAPLVIENKFATTSPGKLCFTSIWNCLPAAASATGMISPLFISTTSPYSWTATSTFSTTSWNGIGLTFFTPNASTPASSTVPAFNGSNPAVLTPMRVTRMIYLSTSSIAVAASAATSTIFSTSVLGNTLGASGIIHGKVPLSGMTFIAGENPVFEIGYGTASTTINFPVGFVPPVNAGGYLEFWLSGSGTTATQRLTVTGQFGTATTTTKTTSLTQDSTTAKQLIFQVRAPNTTPANFLTAEQAIIEAQ